MTTPIFTSSEGSRDRTAPNARDVFMRLYAKHFGLNETEARRAIYFMGQTYAAYGVRLVEAELAAGRVPDVSIFEKKWRLKP